MADDGRQREVVSVTVIYEYSDGRSTRGEITRMVSGAWHWLFRNVFRRRLNMYNQHEVRGFGRAERLEEALWEVAAAERATPQTQVQFEFHGSDA